MEAVVSLCAQCGFVGHCGRSSRSHGHVPDGSAGGSPAGRSPVPPPPLTGRELVATDGSGWPVHIQVSLGGSFRV